MDTLPAVIPEDDPEINALVETLRLELEQGKKTVYWNLGKHIKAFLLKNADRAGFGEELFNRLPEKLGVGKRNLYLCVQFYEAYPQFVHSSTQITWTHYRTLISIPEQSAREAYEERIIKENLSVSELKGLVRSEKGRPSMPEVIPTLAVTRTAPYVYRLKTVEDKSILDLGFNIYIEHTASLVLHPLDQSIPTLGSVAHYTYQATVLEVVDGDTLWVKIDLGCRDIVSIQKVRLRGVNAAELDCAAGQAAKAYIEKQLEGCAFIAVKTYWRDKYTRYLADIFYRKNETDLNHLIKTGTYLNQKLLDKKLVERY